MQKDDSGRKIKTFLKFFELFFLKPMEEAVTDHSRVEKWVKQLNRRLLEICMVKKKAFKKSFN